MTNGHVWWGKHGVDEIRSDLGWEAWILQMIEGHIAFAWRRDHDDENSAGRVWSVASLANSDAHRRRLVDRCMSPDNVSDCSNHG
ncbi:hypothetical protein ACGE24_01745 [Corynebacterium kroppenstedtii]